MIYAKSIFTIARGLMFSSKKRIDKGMCLKLPHYKDSKYGAATTNLFVFYPLAIIYVNSKFKIVDKIVLKPWVFNYVPKSSCMYIIESTKGKFDNLNVGDVVKIEM